MINELSNYSLDVQVRTRQEAIRQEIAKAHLLASIARTVAPVHRRAWQHLAKVQWPRLYLRKGRRRAVSAP